MIAKTPNNRIELEDCDETDLVDIFKLNTVHKGVIRIVAGNNSFRDEAGDEVYSYNLVVETWKKIRHTRQFFFKTPEIENWIKLPEKFGIVWSVE